MKNRYFEKNPFLNEDGASMLARPGMKFLMDVGEGPIRGMYSAPGSFGGDLFVVSYDTLYRINKNKVVSTLQTNMFNPFKGVVNMTSTAPIGTTPAFLFVADGRNLFVYTESGFAFGTLTGTPANNDVVEVGGVYYKFTSGAVNVGAPAGTSANPWLVALGSTTTAAFQNLADAFRRGGAAGTQYSPNLAANTAIKVQNVTGSLVTVQATAAGLFGNSVTTTETGAALAWTGATLSGGGLPNIHAVETPDDVGIIDVATTNSFVICVPVQGEDRNGRFYWIDPGETIIDPLNFATAESKPDGIYGVKALGDQFWLPGAGSTEVWYTTGDPINRMRRLNGVVFDRGTWEGTAAASHESMIICDAEGAVFQIMNGSAKRISTPDVEETIRKAIQYQQNMTP